MKEKISVANHYFDDKILRQWLYKTLLGLMLH